MDKTNPPSDAVYHRFPPDFWEKVGFAQNSLADNRLGRLAEDQEIFFMGDAFRVGCNVVFVLGALLVVLAVVAHRSTFKPVEFMAAVGLLLAFAAFFSFFTMSMLRDLNRDRNQRQVLSFCGELTSWISLNTEGFTDDLHGLQHESHSVHTTEKAWAALPKKAHYRIYFTPRQRNVVNVEEHTDDAPHVWPMSS